MALTVVTAKPQKLGPVVVAKPAKLGPVVTAKPAPIRTVGNANGTQQVSVQQAAQQLQVIQSQEAARQKEVLRVATQSTLDSKVASNRQNLTVTVAKAPKLNGVASPRKLLTIRVADTRPKGLDLEQHNAYWDAVRDVEKSQQTNKKGFSKFIDKVTFGQDRRAIASRGYAAKKLDEISKSKVSAYQTATNSFLAERAKRQAAIEASKFGGNQAAYEKAVNDYNKWQESQIAGLNKTAAQLKGASYAYDAKSSAKLNTKIATVAAKAGTISQTTAGGALGKVWQYTLGQGSENLPSLVTAPSRIVNTIGNLNTNNRNIYQEGGGSVNRLNTGKNAWQSSFNQRSFNLRPWVDIPYNSAEAEKKFGAEIDKRIANEKAMSGKKIGWTGTVGGGKAADPEKLTREYWRKALWDGYNTGNRLQNSALDLAADPINILGGAGAVAKSVGWTSKLAEAAKGTRLAGFVTKAAEGARASKPLDWLLSEAKSPNQKLLDTVEDAKKAQGEYQKTAVPRIRELRSNLSKDGLDYGVFDELAGLSDDEALALQRISGGQLAMRDRLRMVGNKEGRKRLVELSDRYRKFSNEQAGADNITEKESRYLNKKRQYFAKTNFLPTDSKDLSKYDFRKAKKSKRLQNSRDLYQSQVDRFFKSLQEEKYTGTRAAEKAELDKLLSGYDETVGKSREAVEVAYKKTRTPYGRLRGFNDRFGPTSLWKKSVLKYRPAWYVNNFLYNTQGAALAGGGRALVEQAKMFKPGNYKRALESVPENVRANVASEIGNGRIARFGNRVENISRVAAFKALKRKGLDDDRALKRVNSYLLDYKTRNIERPIKAIAPFYSFQKGVAKAAVKMPFDRPTAALGYNKADQYQRQQFDAEFDKMVPELKKYGYSDADIATMRKEQAKYFKGRLKVGKHWITTPFNSFSEKGISNFGLNPYLAAAGEISNSTDSFGRTVKGSDSSISARLMSKFPQAQIGKEGAEKFILKRKTTSKWIGGAGSEGYGLTKEAQGYDPTKQNYQKSLDKGSRFWQDLTAFGGVPSHLEFNKDEFLGRKKMQALKTEYFAMDTKDKPYDEVVAMRDRLFSKYGVGTDDFYDGELSKYDDANTKRIKAQKKEAAELNDKLFGQYGSLPKGEKGKSSPRTSFAVSRLRELVGEDYFSKNPFLKSFKFVDPTVVAKQKKADIVKRAVDTGAWDEYRKEYGTSAKYQKYLDYTAAKKSGDFSAYSKKYGVSEKAARAQFFSKYFATTDKTERRKMLADNPQYKKLSADPEKVARAQFWEKYANATRAGRKRLMDENPQYNERKDWTVEQWDNWKAEQKAILKGKARSVAGFTDRETRLVSENRRLASPILNKNRRNRLATLKLA